MQLLLFILFSLMTAAGFAWVFNNPYPKNEANQKVYYTSFAEQPKTLDPARSYSSNEYQFIAQIYEPLLEYDYLARPYELVPLAASEMPDITYLDAEFKPITDFENQAIAYSVYTLHLKRGMHYQPHPALARDEKGHYRYLQLPPNYLDSQDISELSDFRDTGTREVVADDYIYQIKRLADPASSSPIYGLMSNAILGFKEFGQQLQQRSSRDGFIDLRKYPFAGLKKLDDYTFQITILRQYPQFLFWLAMPFFSPIPWEADQFYAQQGMRKNNLSFDWYPIGSGPFMLAENNPNRQMRLRKNPNYHAVFSPRFATVDDEQAGYLKGVGKPMPFLDEIIYTLEKESIPRWNKFLQGYYDLSGVTMDSFDQVIQIGPTGRPALTSVMQDKKISLTEAIESTIFYLGFNMRDPVVGGNSERARRLRLAISIAVNLDEYIAIFYNGRGQVAQGPIPPGIFGHDKGSAGINPYVYQWRHDKPERRSLKEAKHWLAAAGYARGIDPNTGRPLVLNYDIAMTTRPDEKAQLDWMRKQFARLGIDLNLRATEYNRFQEKMRYGNAQIFYWGWSADYPDPENFLNLLYGPNSKVEYGGENAANYHNAKYDQLFELMRNHPNDDLRKKRIAEMLAIVRHDAPWIWGINTEMLTLSQQWVNAVKPNAFSYNTLKYMTVDAVLRNQLRTLWNQAVFWPLILLVFLIMLGIVPLLLIYRRQEKQGASRGEL
ncbi:MAG: peptide ABC transporter substrate-binding protein [Legionellales bacterium RIFCSPHIGHO2_12_FULL_42_9]|nr:MAG: peptide ABC transporter substrate-binding protein [Legionellales bacterium RIFCSPHIGHO2_12_FULL_42_9]